MKHRSPFNRMSPPPRHPDAPSVDPNRIHEDDPTDYDLLAKDDEPADQDD